MVVKWCLQYGLSQPVWDDNRLHYHQWRYMHEQNVSDITNELQKARLGSRESARSPARRPSPCGYTEQRLRSHEQPASRKTVPPTDVREYHIAIRHWTHRYGSTLRTSSRLESELLLSVACQQNVVQLHALQTVLRHPAPKHSLEVVSSLDWFCRHHLTPTSYCPLRRNDVAKLLLVSERI